MSQWYETIQPNSNISQGDIILNCPIFVPKYPKIDMQNIDFDNINSEYYQTEVLRSDVVVLSQACDLEVREGQESPKLQQVLVAVLDDVRTNAIGKNNLETLIKLNKSELYLLDPCHDEVKLGYKIVRFDHIHVIPWTIINLFAKQSSPHLRIKSPYLEQMIQHLGHHIGRVAVPENRVDRLEEYYGIKTTYEQHRKEPGNNKLKKWDQLTEDEIVNYISSIK